MEPLDFDSTDVGRIEELVSDLYSTMRIEAVGDLTRARISRRAISPAVGFDDLDYTFDIGYSAEPPDHLIICDILSNTIDDTGQGRDDTFGPGDQFLISRPGLPYSGLAHAPRLEFTLLDPSLLTRVAAPEAGGDGQVRLLDNRPISAQAAHDLRRSIAYVRGTVLSDTEPSPLVASTASQIIAASVLQAYPNSARTESTPQDHHDAHPATVRRAIAFIDAHIGADIDLVAVAEAAHVSPQALRDAFLRHVGTTFTAYVRRTRLDAAHRELQAADPGLGTDIEAIATRWGFAHVSRFVALYEEAYGRSPRSTLHT
ncbi:helix-turn-helix transcriptional regulator [Rhodococcoides kyotonense]|uniref:AraC-type DNA-binding protein n=1 Tax=Rhodococcoides kyotonense TaxID=398843 RepID=A0A239FC53_9NOCA|nr:helix-turn-helix transcriptional regulator [Rhodococcus kyotonensis]SNS54630.1 AraC-type DNA-binding protein [Rhodococcus kyotonensis]